MLKLAETLRIPVTDFFEPLSMTEAVKPADRLDVLDDGTELYAEWRRLEVREEGGVYRLVDLDPAGIPLQDELEELRAWLPDNAARRLARQVTPRVWLGILYALGAEEHWPRSRLDRIHAAMVAYDEAQQGGEEGSGGS